MDIETNIKRVVREVLEEFFDSSGRVDDPELITTKQAQAMLGVGKTAIYDMIHNRDETGFPAYNLTDSRNGWRIDKRKLTRWIASRGAVV
jgi:hypothetical protein